MKRNGYTSAKTPRWRCKNTHCRGISESQRNEDARLAKYFRLFHSWILGKQSLNDVATQAGCSARTLRRHFQPFWYVIVPHNNDPYRIYDQVFIDGTYFNKNCLLIASTNNHVISWHFGFTESSDLYHLLFDQIAPPLVITTDGQKGALKAVREHFPNTKVQRCLVHVQRGIYKETTKNPQTTAGKALRRIGTELITIDSTDKAEKFLDHVQKFGEVFDTWLNEKTYVKDVPYDQIPKSKRNNKTYWYTHEHIRRGYHGLKKMIDDDHLFTFLTPPEDATNEIKRHTNTLEGHYNREIKTLIDLHRGLSAERQRVMCDWYLLSHTEHAPDPVEIARQQNWGRDRLAKVHNLVAQHQAKATNQIHDRLPIHASDIDTIVDNTTTIRKGTMR